MPAEPGSRSLLLWDQSLVHTLCVSCTPCVEVVSFCVGEREGRES
jgi:hypothetical protein